MLAAGAPSAGNSAAQVRRSRGGRGSGSTNGRAACKCPGPDEPMRAAAALRRGTGWLRGEAGPEGGTAPVIHAPVPYTHAGPGPGAVPAARSCGRRRCCQQRATPRTPKLSAKEFSALPQRRGAPPAAPGNQSPASARAPRAGARLGGRQPRAAPGETRSHRPCGDGTCPLPTGTSSHGAVPLCRAGAALLGRGAGGAAGTGAGRDACGWERERERSPYSALCDATGTRLTPSRRAAPS